MTDTTVAPAESATPAYLQSASDVLRDLDSDVDRGLSAATVASRQAEYGPNEITGEKPPSLLAVAFAQLRDPMNLMLVFVSVASFLIDQRSTAILVGVLVLVNVVIGARQEMKARASVSALADLQTPQARVVRDGDLQLVAATELVPGDIVRLEAGDIVPADGRIVVAATLETQEAALTGESAPIPKDANPLSDPDTALADRTNMVFQNTSVTRGTATFVVTATGMRTQMGQIAHMLTSIDRSRSPLQRELDRLTTYIGILAWTAVVVVVVTGVARGMEFDEVLLLGTAMAIGAIPTGMPTFVQALLARGASQLAAAKAIVKNLADVETLGATSAINSDKTGTLTMNQMMVSTVYLDDTWLSVSGEGYAKTGTVRAPAGVETPDLSTLTLASALCSDATVSDAGDVVGDPTEAALVVLAEKLGVDVEETRRVYPRLAEVPFDSDYKFMATFHRVPINGADTLVEVVKGAPDVVLARCRSVGTNVDDTTKPIDDARAAIEAANRRLGEQGLRVLLVAGRVIDPEHEATMQSEPMALTTDLTFLGMVGIIDPLRPEAKAAVTTAQAAGIDVRMITGDHAVTAQAIGAELGLGPGAISGAELHELTDEQLTERIGDLHVFGRVTPEDKLRLVRTMQAQGMVVAMTGDAVNDAAALKQADIGVAMGSGSEVTKQAGRMILTDDNFGTLVNAVELGRRVYATVTAYVRYQMAQLISIVLLFVVATAANINQGVALTPLMVLFLNFFICLFPVAVIAVDPGDPDIMKRPPRDPKVTITNRPAVSRWIVYSTIMFLGSLVPLLWGPDTLSIDHPSASMTMAYVVLGLATILSGFVFRHDPASAFTPPILEAVKLLAIPTVLLVLSTELGFLQRALMAQPLTGGQWLVCIGLALLMPIAVELDKWWRRRHHAAELA